MNTDPRMSTIRFTMRPEKSLEVSSSEREPRSLRLGNSPSPITLGGAVVGCALIALYLGYVSHYSVNAIYWDDWTVVPLIHAALHGHLTFGALWVQHGENRMLIPNLIMVGVGAVTHDNTTVIVLLSAAVLIASYVVFLALLHSYLLRPVTVVSVLSTGLIWFSLADYFNAVWAFQFAWYLIVFLFVSMLYLVIREKHKTFVLGVATVAAIAASYSSVQGLLLWPVGLMCLWWPLWRKPETRTRRAYTELALWTLIGAITAAVYFWRYAPKSIGQVGAVDVQPPSWALKHPFGLARFLLVDIGNVIPSSGTDVVGHEILGVLLCIMAGVVVVKCGRDRRNVQCPLPVALIAFAILFDLTVSTGRLSLGLAYAFKSRYTMPNLLLLVAIVSFALKRLPPAHTSHSVLSRAWKTAILLAGSIFIVGQIVASTMFGVSKGATFKQEFVASARLTVNLDHIPRSEWGCYELFGTFPNVYLVSDLPPLLGLAKRDQLGPFASGPERTYLAEGAPPPIWPHCISSK